MDVEVESNPILSTVIFWKMPEIPFFVFFKERESGRDGERKEEKHRWLPLACALTRNPTCNLGLRPDQESSL